MFIGNLIRVQEQEDAKNYGLSRVNSHLIHLVIVAIHTHHFRNRAAILHEDGPHVFLCIENPPTCRAGRLHLLGQRFHITLVTGGVVVVRRPQPCRQTAGTVTVATPRHDIFQVVHADVTAQVLGLLWPLADPRIDVCYGGGATQSPSCTYAASHLLLVTCHGQFQRRLCGTPRHVDNGRHAD